MLMPWSPSPIAESSCVRWSASASMAAADPVIQSSTDSTWLTAIGAPTLRPPAERGGVDGSIPQLRQLVVELEQRQRCPGHLQRRDVRTDQRADRLQPGRAQPALDLPVEQVELEQRCAAHPVDERQHLRAAP